MKAIYLSGLDSDISDISFDTASPSSSDSEIEMLASSDSNTIIYNHPDTFDYKSSNDVEDDDQNKHFSSDSGNYSCTLCNVLIIYILFTCMYMRILCICTFIYK